MYMYELYTVYIGLTSTVSSIILMFLDLHEIDNVKL